MESTFMNEPDHLANAALVWLTRANMYREKAKLSADPLSHEYWLFRAQQALLIAERLEGMKR